MNDARPEKRTNQNNQNNKKKRLYGRISNKKTRAEITIYKGGIDRWFLIFVILMVCVGTAMIFSASYVSALDDYGDSYFYVKKQLQMAALGMVMMIISTYIANYNLIKKLTIPFFTAVLVLNYLTPFLGKTAKGAHRWIIIGGIQFQPSELLKLAVIFLFSWYIERMSERMREFKWGILVPCGIIAVIAVAMGLQRHFSGLIIITLIGIAIIFIGEAPWQWLAGFATVGFSGVAAIIMFTSYASSRVTSWLDPWADPTDAGFQIIQSLYAIASGGLTGLGLGQSRQKYLYLPEPQNDFIFSIICEELGFIGALVIITMFILLIWRGIVIAYGAPDKFSAFVVMGIIIKVALQFILNLAVVTNTIPNTGIPLPFFSYGGTALVVLLVEMGIILCISRYSYHEKT